MTVNHDETHTTDDESREDTLPFDVEVKAACLDVELTTTALVRVMGSIRRLTRVPRPAPFALAEALLRMKVHGGDRVAVFRLREFETAASAYEGARVALADLTGLA